MEKVILTTYRKLYKMCCRVDASVAMRTQLVCCPLQVYDHRSMEWRSFDLSQMDWAESRMYLDGLIRRLNNGRPQYIPPLPEEAARAVEEYRLQCAHMLAEEERKATAAEGERMATHTSTADAKSGAETTPTSTSGESSASGTRGSTIPLNVMPYSKLTVALRQIYEETPFSMSNVANSFAAVKELQYVCDLDNAGRANLITLSSTTVELAPPFSSTNAIPHLQRALEVAPLHNSLINGLSAEQRVSLDRQSRLVRRSAQRKKKNSASESMAAATAAAAAGLSVRRRTSGNVFDDAPELGEAEEVIDEDGDDDNGDDEEEVDLSDKVERDEPMEVQTETTTAAGEKTAAPEMAPTGEELCGSLPSTAELVEEPKQVQFLLSHPTARGFFRRTVLLMVRHVKHESAAFVLNKPLRNDEGIEMSIESTVRLGRVHPIFRRYLTQHTLMIGGPVMSGSSFDESIFLLHRVPGVPNALPLGSGLWMDGDLDALMAKLDAKEASAERDVIVLCGFAGWGFDQLKGELSNGYWVVASGPSEDPAIGSFVMSLAHTTVGRPQPQQQQDGQGKTEMTSSSAVAGVSDAETSAEATTETTTTAASSRSNTEKSADAPLSENTEPTSEEESIRAQAQRAADAATSRAIPALKYRRRRAENGKGKDNRIETLSWVRAFASLGKPYADMAMNQKAYAKDDDFQE